MANHLCKLVSLVHIIRSNDKNSNQKNSINHYSIKVGDWLYYLNFKVKKTQIKTIIVKEFHEKRNYKVIKNFEMISLSDSAIWSTCKSLIDLFHSENICICLDQDWFFEYFCRSIGVSVELNCVNYFENLNIDKSFLALEENKEVAKFIQEFYL